MTSEGLQPARALALRLTLLCLVLYPGLFALERLPLLLIGAAGLAIPFLARSPLLWLLAALATGGRVLIRWPQADNHDFLIFYWCTAIAVSLASARPDANVARNARLLVGLSMAFATLWKGVLSPDFLDGTVFRTLFLADARFEGLALSLGGLDAASLEANDAFLAGAGGSLHEPARLRGLAYASTAFTLVMEAAIAVTFLLGSRLRHALLLAFAIPTYALLPVAGFGWVLMAMGAASCDAHSRWPQAYTAAFLWILLVKAGDVL